MLTHNLISSTSNEVTIALPDGKTTSADIDVDIEISGNTDRKSLTFTNGKAKFLMEDLTAKTSYTIKVKIYNNDVAGDEAMLSFSQGLYSSYIAMVKLSHGLLWVYDLSR